MADAAPTSDHVETGDAVTYYAAEGSGPPLVLLHGFPQTHLCWARMLPHLREHYRVITPDLRGLGRTTKPLHGYDKRTVARDVWTLVHDHLGHERFFLAGHDWGGVTAFRLAADHPEAVARLAVVDVAIPGDGARDISAGGTRWHHGFLRTPDMPEALVAGREDVFLGWFYENYGHRPDALDPAHVAEYLRLYARPGALRAAFSYYRAVGQDVADNEGARLTMPVLAVGGGSSWGRGDEVAASLRSFTDDVTGHVLDEAGHWVPDEQPRRLAELFTDFFGATL
jgi:pimeloyl-ACP methyl ester carboxylesterase